MPMPCDRFPCRGLWPQNRIQRPTIPQPFLKLPGLAKSVSLGATPPAARGVRRARFLRSGLVRARRLLRQTVAAPHRSRFLTFRGLAAAVALSATPPAAHGIHRARFLRSGLVRARCLPSANSGSATPQPFLNLPGFCSIGVAQRDTARGSRRPPRPVFAVGACLGTAPPVG